MNWKKFFGSWDGMRLQNRAQRYMIFCLIASNVVIGLVAFGRSEVVVLTPPVLEKPVKVARDHSDQSYAEAWSVVLADLLGNVTPASVDYVKRLVAPMLAPTVYQEVTNALVRQAEQIKLDRVTTSFEPREVIYEPKTTKVFVMGNSVVSGPVGRDERTPRTYEFIVKVRNYQPYVTHVDTYRGHARTIDNEARTASVRKREEKTEQAALLREEAK